MRNRPIISIIIPAYNVGSLISEAIESCLGQKDISQDDFEIIVVNDGSTDNTFDYIQKYEGISNVRILNQPNGGLSNARNNGMDRAKGEYILFLDGDDWLSSEALAILLPLAKPDTILQFPLNYWYSEEDNELKGCGINEGVYNPLQFLRLTLGRSQFQEIPAPKKLYPAKLLRDNNLRFVEGIYHEDNPFYVDVMMHCLFVRYVNRNIYYYRQNRTGSITASKTMRNFNGVVTGNEYILNKYGMTNKDITHLVSNTYVFQMIGAFENQQHRATVMSFFRRPSMKIRLSKIFFKSRWRIKSQIRLLLLIFDPKLLCWVLKLV
ncbi:glycosyltransferase [uncultured Muribaculum sp.]|uniref:glycosyltransferase family 2 protein n=1 Tax=uncultured Muribaculum sp. TaxID=1918613 RepID=UPI00260D98DB|nr:glycosyltransferase [uncultured Muribaculum sp.]